MIRSRLHALTAAAALIAMSACSSDISTPNALSLDSAFDTAPAGMDIVSSSFTGDESRTPWGGPTRERSGEPGADALMGGGLQSAFIGGAAPGRGAHRGPFAVRIDGSCTFAASLGELTCGPVARGPLTVTTIYNIEDGNGTAQSAIDTVTTNSVRIRTSVSGTVTRTREANVTATVRNVSDREISGLAANSNTRTVNGSAEGSERASGTTRDGRPFTALRTSSETTRNLSIPVSDRPQNFPTAGTVVRTMTVVTTVDGGTAETNTRREQVTFDGSNVATLVITQNGTVRNCTLALPRGRLVCRR